VFRSDSKVRHQLATRSLQAATSADGVTLVLVVGFPAGSFGTNCYLVAPGPGERCVIIDPGQDAVPGIDEALRAHRLKPAAVVATHGHVDHVWSVVPVCGAHDVPAYVHPADLAQLADPVALMDADLVAALGLVGVTFGEPDDVRPLVDGAQLDLAGLRFAVESVPGHTPGSINLGLATADDPLLFTGDLLFAGSIGRTDLPGGDYPAIVGSLRRTFRKHADETVVLPGHGQRTTIGRERATNPFVRQFMGASA
jgi:hydroxyacylglutathione hydrolase